MLPREVYLPGNREHFKDSAPSRVMLLILGWRMWGKHTLCHKECNRAQIMSSRKTKCHDTSSPVEYSEESNTALCHNRKELVPLTKARKAFVWNERK